MSVKVAINGFGRIGRDTLRAYFEKKNNNFEIAVINGIKNIEETLLLIKYDSLYGKFDRELYVEDDCLVIDGKKIKITNERDEEKLPWKQLGIDIVLESTGKFNNKEASMRHINAGAKKVIITAPGKNADATIVMGVNEEVYDINKHHIISNASCTTNCLAPMVKVLLEEFGIKKGLMTTVHAYTNNQNVLDAINKKDLRRARAAAESIIPTTTGAAKVVTLVIPELEGKLNGMAMRVPTPTVSVVDLTVELEKTATVEEINSAFEAAEKGRLKDILGISKDPLVSVDYKKDSRSSIIDGLSTMVVDNMAKIVSWYDNEWGYSCRVVDLTNYIASKM